MKILILNGPNLNLLGKREPEIYGTQTFEDYFSILLKKYPALDLEYFQSNSEGAIIDKIHETGFSYNGIIINPGAYAHTSVAIADAISGIKSPVLEVHISNVHAREAFRHHSVLTARCVGSIIGLGLKGYDLGVEFFIDSQ